MAKNFVRLVFNLVFVLVRYMYKIRTASDEKRKKVQWTHY